MTRDPGRERSGSRPGVVPTAGVAAAAVLAWSYAWWAVGRAPFSTAATVAVVVPGMVVAALAVLAPGPGSGHRSVRGHERPRPGLGSGHRSVRGHERPGPRPAGAPAGAWRWAVLAALLAAWQLAAYLQHPRHDHPTLSSLANAALDTHAAQAAAFLAWLAVMVLLVRR